MRVISVDAVASDGFLDYYLDRFRAHPPHWAAEDGWMVGVAGRYQRSETPRTTAYGTFSSFAKWDSLPPKEHVGAIADLLSEWQATRAQQWSVD